MSPIAFLKTMLAAGMDLDTALIAAESFEQEAQAHHDGLVAKLLDRLSKDEKAEARRAKDRERKQVRAGIPRNSADSAEQRKAPRPQKELPPIPPLKGGTFPQTDDNQPEKPAEPAKPLSAWVDEFWDISPRAARARTSKADIERSLRGAIRRGRDPAEMFAALVAYFASPDATKDDGKFAKGTHRLIENDRWEAFAGAAEPKAVAALRDPWPGRITEYRLANYWNSQWGPKPGKPGCKIPPEILMANGFIPPPAPTTPEPA